MISQYDAISSMATGTIFLLYEQFSGSYCELRAVQNACSSQVLLTGAQWGGLLFSWSSTVAAGQSVSLDGPAS